MALWRRLVDGQPDFAGLLRGRSGAIDIILGQ